MTYIFVKKLHHIVNQFRVNYNFHELVFNLTEQFSFISNKALITMKMHESW